MPASYTYLSFPDPKRTEDRLPSQDSKLGKAIAFVLKRLLPQANPTFETIYPKVTEWLIEFDSENNYTNREVGLDTMGCTVAIGPYQNDLGFWTDTDLTLADFKSHFSCSIISPQYFEARWNAFTVSTPAGMPGANSVGSQEH